MCTFFLVVAFHDARFLSGLYHRFFYIVYRGPFSSKNPVRNSTPKIPHAFRALFSTMAEGVSPLRHPFFATKRGILLTPFLGDWT